MQQSFHALAGGVEGEVEGEQARQLFELRHLAKATTDALQRGVDEFQVMQTPAEDGHFGERAEDLERALEEGLEVAETEPGIGVAESGVVVDELHLRGLTQDAGHAAVAQKRRE